MVAKAGSEGADPRAPAHRQPPAAGRRVLAQAEAAGATIGRAGAPTLWCGYSGIFIDPDGHPWEIAHNPGWVLGDDGSVRLR